MMAEKTSVGAGAGADRKAKGPKRTPRTEKPRGRRKTAIGYVVSDKMQKTIVVELEDRVKHPLYGKIIRTTKKVKAHDENGDAGIGDRVSLMETRPLSATKRWRLVEILERAK
jgi:small subunit ribosomal protein S17